MPFAAGCRREEQISRYRIPKEHVLLKTNGPEPGEVADEGPVTHRMLAAMVPRGEQAWFFRLIGPAEAVAAEGDNFRTLIKSIHFADENASPEWTLPTGWQQKPSTGMRFATIDVPSADGPLDLSVTMLPRNEPDIDVYALSNLNRWRGQLGLKNISLGALRDSVETLDAGGTQAMLFDIAGREPQNNMSRAPFAGGAMPPARPQAENPAPRAAAPAANSELHYTVPTGWTSGEAGGFRKAAFTIVDGQQKAECTVISLGGGGGALLPNVNRWRQQIGLADVDFAELERDMQKIDIAGTQAVLVELVGAEKSILGAILPREGESWFFKLSGDKDLVAREKQNFESFVRSVSFAGNGK